MSKQEDKKNDEKVRETKNEFLPPFARSSSDKERKKNKIKKINKLDGGVY